MYDRRLCSLLTGGAAARLEQADDNSFVHCGATPDCTGADASRLHAHALQATHQLVDTHWRKDNRWPVLSVHIRPGLIGLGWCSQTQQASVSRHRRRLSSGQSDCSLSFIRCKGRASRCCRTKQDIPGRSVSHRTSMPHRMSQSLSISHAVGSGFSPAIRQFATPLWQVAAAFTACLCTSRKALTPRHY